jgi:hypothetical protein
MPAGNPTCHILVVRKKRLLLLRLLPLRLVVNDTDIHQLRENHPVIIKSAQHPTRLVVTNGFHHAGPVLLDTAGQDKLALEVDCEIDNIRIFSTLLITLMLFAFYWVTGMRGLQIAANIPLLYLLWFFYFNRNKIIVIRPLAPEGI